MAAELALTSAVPNLASSWPWLATVSVLVTWRPLPALSAEAFPRRLKPEGRTPMLSPFMTPDEELPVEPDLAACAVPAARTALGCAVEASMAASRCNDCSLASLLALRAGAGASPNLKRAVNSDAKLDCLLLPAAPLQRQPFQTVYSTR